MYLLSQKRANWKSLSSNFKRIEHPTWFAKSETGLKISGGFVGVEPQTDERERGGGGEDETEFEREAI
jgi:hypothetical protein